MLIVVTGATGFIGGHLARALAASGHRVRATARETSNTTEIEADGIEIRRGSLLDESFAAEVCQDADIVFNLMGRMGGPSVREKDMHLVNVDAVTTLLKACRKSRVRQFIHCSTPGVVGMVGVAPECMPYRPAGPYERSKCDGEKAVILYSQNGGVPATVVRPDFVYGPGDMHKLKMFRTIKEGRFPIIGSGRSLLHPTYVEDVIRGLMIVMDNQAAYGEIFNIAGPEPVSVAGFIGAIADGLGVKPPRMRVPTLAAGLAAVGSEIGSAILRREPPLTRYQVKFFTRSHTSDISKARQMLGFEPLVRLDEGIPKTIGWYLEKGYL